MIFFDSEKFIAEAIESVLRQTIDDWELVLVDDGSTDASTAIAKHYAARDPRVRYLDHPGHENRGMSTSRNRGARATSAPYLVFLDSDDVWEPAMLAEQRAVLEADPNIALVCGALLYWRSWDGDGKDDLVLTGARADETVRPPEALLSFYPLGAAPGAGTALMVRREVYEAVGGFEEGFRGMYEDQAFLTKIYLDHSIFVSSRSWTKYRRHAGSCCSISMSTKNDYNERRLSFLIWLEGHVAGRAGATPAVLAAIRSARRRARYAQLRSIARRGRDLIRSSLPVGAR